jgi:hypothetical protein
MNIDINKLNEYIEQHSKTADEKMLYCNVFATACYLHKDGKVDAAIKLFRSLFNQLDYSTFLKSFLSVLPGNESSYAQAINANLEIKTLFNAF